MHRLLVDNISTPRRYYWELPTTGRTTGRTTGNTGPRVPLPGNTRVIDLSEVTLFRAQALRVKRYSYWICVRRKRAGADGGFTAVQLHADKNRRAPHGHVAEPA